VVISCYLFDESSSFWVSVVICVCWVAPLIFAYSRSNLLCAMVLLMMVCRRSISWSSRVILAWYSALIIKPVSFYACSLSFSLLRSPCSCESVLYALLCVSYFYFNAISKLSLNSDSSSIIFRFSPYPSFVFP
jgi:hypothetical protein